MAVGPGAVKAEERGDEVVLRTRGAAVGQTFCHAPPEVFCTKMGTMMMSMEARYER